MAHHLVFWQAFDLLRLPGRKPPTHPFHFHLSNSSRVHKRIQNYKKIKFWTPMGNYFWHTVLSDSQHKTLRAGDVSFCFFPSMWASRCRLNKNIWNLSCWVWLGKSNQGVSNWIIANKVAYSTVFVPILCEISTL